MTSSPDTRHENSGPTDLGPTKELQTRPVANANSPRPRLNVRLTAGQRRNALLIGCLLFALLGLARMLEPDASGLGTHRQLGLPPCTTVALFGIPCPTCGMTTSWSHLMHGELAASWAANPGGTCLAIAAALAGLWSLVASARGSYRPLLTGRIWIAITLAITAITLIDWATKIF